MIAISYRREDTLPIAGRLYDRLQATFGKANVFMDFDSIRPGLDFRDQIRDTIDRSELVIAIIGPNWVGQKNDASRRIDDPHDFVRLEVAHALKRDIPIIPVLINNTPMPSPETLPPELQGLAFRHALPLDSGLDFHQHADRVISGIRHVVKDTVGSATGAFTSAAGETAAGRAAGASRSRSRSLIVIGLILAATAAAIATWLVLPRLTTHTTERRPSDESIDVHFRQPEATPAPLAKPVVEISSKPSGASVMQNGTFLGTTPLRRDDLATGETNFLVTREGFLPRALKATIDSRNGLKAEISLSQPAPYYRGEIRVREAPNSLVRYIVITLAPGLNTGTMTQTSKHGDFTVKFTGVWEGTALHAVTADVITQPALVHWTPESFVLRWSDNGQTVNYECMADGVTYFASLAAQSQPRIPAGASYKGTIRKRGLTEGPGVPLTISFQADKTSGTETQTSKSGDTIVKFSGAWEGPVFHAVTNEIVAKPKNIQWTPESFSLHFGDDGKTAVYQCVAGGETLWAQLSTP